jgi:hypothetical protein
MELAGGKVTMDQGLRTHQAEAMMRDWYGGKPFKAALRSPIALSEAMMKPVIGYLVPRQKVGVFGELAGRIMEQNPGKTLEQLRPELRQAWNRVDARLGQVAYDRLFIRNQAKNAMQFFIRAPGWSGGTIAEIGGSGKDATKFVAEWLKTGKAPADMPDRVAYTLSLLGTIFATNGALTKAFTGEFPTGRDWWAFRDGTKDKYGNPNRWLVPSYVKDIYAWWENPEHTFTSKLHPAISLGLELKRGYDYYGNMFRDSEESFNQQTKDTILHAIGGFEPFWTRGARKAGEAEGGVLETLKKSPAKILAPEIGVMPASRMYTATPAMKKMDEYKQLQGQRITQKEDVAVNQTKHKIVDLLRQNKQPEAKTELIKLLKEKKITKSKADKWLGRVGIDVDDKGNVTIPLPQVNTFKSLKFDQALKVYELADPNEKKLFRSALEKKINNLPADEFELKKPLIQKVLKKKNEESPGIFDFLKKTRPRGEVGNEAKM